MRIFVAGGSGRVATELIKDLIADGNTVVAGARHEDHIIKLNNVKPVHMDLHASVDDLANRCIRRCKDNASSKEAWH